MHPPQTRQPATVRRHFLGSAITIVLALASGTIIMGAEPGMLTVRLVVDYGDGVQTHFTALPWREGMTALDALTAAQAHPRGIKFDKRGSGASAMITKIGDLKNEGDGKNWIFYVNDKSGEASAGVTKLKSGDTVLWKFQVYDYNP